MFLTQSNVIRGLTKDEYKILREMCVYSNNLYNVALYNIRQYYFSSKRFLTYESNCSICNSNENYSLLQAGISQQILKVADRNFKSFFNLSNKCKTSDYRYYDVKMPTYRKKGSLYNLILSTNAITIKDGYLKLPLSFEFRKRHPGIKKILIPFPERLEGKDIKEVRIIPVHNGKYFNVQYVYKEEIENKNLNPNNMLSIDIGVDNLATCVSNVGTPFIIDGRRIKSINQYWNKRKAYLQTIATKQGLHSTELIERITDKRNNQVRDILKKSARYIVDYCCSNNIGTIVVGYNLDFKRYVNLGKNNNQTFTQIPFGDLRNNIAYLCERYGIEYIEQEESYTSKASAIDEDDIPVYNPTNNFDGNFSGKRIYRGLYKSKNGTLINADVNGSANILRKCKQNLSIKELCPGLLVSPLRIRLY